MVDKIEINGKLMAIIVRNGFCESGVHFFTPDNLSQQFMAFHTITLKNFFVSGPAGG